MSETNRIHSLLTAAIIAVALPLGLAACSSGADDSKTAAETAAGIGAKWGECVRDLGFDVDDPDDAVVESGAVIGPEGVDQQAFAAAAAKCSEEVGVQAEDSAQEDRYARQYEQVAQCIRDDGYEDFDGVDEHGGIGTEGYPRAQEPRFQEVFERCIQEHAPETQMVQK